MVNRLNELFKSNPVTVLNVIDEAPGVKTLRLGFKGNYSAQPGQFNMLYYWGVGEAPLSLSNIPNQTEGLTIIEHTVKAIGSVTKSLVENAKEGLLLGLRGPYGRGWPLREYEGFNVLIIAGGMGLAPLKPTIMYILVNRAVYGEVYVLYGARSPNHLIFRREYEYWVNRGRVKLLLTVDNVTEGWRHYVGFVTDLIGYVNVNPVETVVYICGPEVMMINALKKLVDRGFRKDRVFLSVERRMRCGVGVCGTCQLGHFFVCRDGPIFSFEELEEYLVVEGV